MHLSKTRKFASFISARALICDLKGNPMRIAMVSDWYLPRLGGIETQIHDLSVALNAAGHEVEVLTPVPGPGTLGGVCIHRLCDVSREDGGYRFPPSAVANNFRDFFYVVELLENRGDDSALGRLEDMLRRGNYDVVHAQLGNTPFAYLAVNIALRLGLKVVVTFHSMLGAFEQPIAFAISRALGCQKWAGRALLTAVSSNVAQNRAFSVGSHEFKILPNGTNVTYWEQVQSRRAESQTPLKFFAAMRLHPRKRPFALIDSMAALRTQVPAREFPVLHIAGDGHMRPSLEKRIRALDLVDNVILCGRLDRKEIAGYLAKADLFLMPSYLESFGIAALEARMAGVPVLAMKQAGAWDFLTPDMDGIMADNDSDFARKLCEFVLEGNLRARLRLGVTKLLPGYSWPELVAQCQAYYAYNTLTTERQ